MAFMRGRSCHAHMQMLDLDGNGTLDLGEFQRLSYLQESDSSVMDQVFKEADTNKDGQLDKQEFITYNLRLSEDLSDEDFEEKTHRWLAVSLFSMMTTFDVMRWIIFCAQELLI